MMMNDVTNKPPLAFWLVSALLLLWEAAGCAMYLNNVTMDISTLEPDIRALYEATPIWAAAAFAIAVWAGLLAAILLLLRRRQARPLFLISLVAAAAQFIWWLAFSGVFAVLGAASAIMPALVIIIGIFAVWYSRRAATQGWIR
ncbi:hypothetical protein KCG44_11260 [Pacificimonas sp. WHA3]|uniref:Sugar transporter n=1 Tax=Pacificimonas pallii TaxID=2827236 RepID=A0ABS6SG12_9SPHN|nr:hypothetical protein [Pacificimonas pallii]MBV7257363.1 hypothetical protein [Pacificimonas pallii]